MVLDEQALDAPGDDKMGDTWTGPEVLEDEGTLLTSGARAEAGDIAIREREDVGGGEWTLSL
jgi:hypothetical protein